FQAWMPRSSGAGETSSSGHTTPAPGRKRSGFRVSLRLPDGDSQPLVTRHTLAFTEISPSLTCGNHVQHAKQVFTITTIICPNSCPRWRSAQTCLCDSPRDAHSAIAPPTFFQKHEGATPDLVPLPRRSGCGSRFRLIDHERVSSRQIQLKAQPGWLCGELERMRSFTMGAKTDHKGFRAAIRPFPSAIQRSDPICGAARTVSLPTGRDSIPAQKRSDKHSTSRGGSFRLLQPLLPGPKKGRELSANIRSTCVKQSTHAATVQNADPTPACAVYK